MNKKNKTMKELSIEEKAKAYDEALKKARSFYKRWEGISASDSNLVIAEVKEIFPELKESEDERKDERIRKDIIWCLKHSHIKESGPINPHVTTITRDAIAWLEKQGKQDARYKYVEELLEADAIFQMAMNDAMVEEAKNKAIGALSELEISKLLGLEKQGEQILANSAKTGKDEQKSADKDKPKFKVGDKIRRKTPSSFDTDMKVARIDKDYYICNHIGKFSSEVVPFSKESSYELIEQMPSWSEEDEEEFQIVINTLVKGGRRR